MSNTQVHGQDVLGSTMSPEKYPPPGEIPSSKDPKEVSETSPCENQETVPGENTLPISSLILIGVALWFSIFLITLVRPGSRNGFEPFRLQKILANSLVQDGTIVANAIPTITDEFHKISDVGWYGSGMWAENNAVSPCRLNIF